MLLAEALVVSFLCMCLCMCIIAFLHSCLCCNIVQLFVLSAVITGHEESVCTVCHTRLVRLTAFCDSCSKGKLHVVPYSIMSVGHRVGPGFLAVSQQVTLVINLVVGCHHFPPGPRLLSQPKRSPPTDGTKLYCLVSEAHKYKYLACGHYSTQWCLFHQTELW